LTFVFDYFPIAFTRAGVIFLSMEYIAAKKRLGRNKKSQKIVSNPNINKI
jgi:hypothetical protein